MTRAFDFRHKRNFYNRLARLRKFVRSPWAGGVVLILFTVLALVLANLPWTASAYHHLFEARLRIGFDGFSLDEPLEAWVNDGLMAVFFFYVGLEIKREVIAGRLSGLRQAALPLAAALGGMVFRSIRRGRMPRDGACRRRRTSPSRSACCRCSVPACPFR